MLNDPKKILLITVGVLILGALFFVFGGFGGAEQNVILEVTSDKETYEAGEEITLNLNLKNSGESAVCLSNMATGNVRIGSVLRNGEEVETRSAPSYFIIPLPDMLKNKLTSISSGDSMDIALSSSFDAGLGTQALDATKPQDERGMATFYNVGQAGNYTVELFYEYPGEASEDCANILEGATSTTTVTFEVK